MKLVKHDDIVEFVPRQFRDERGLFTETFNSAISSVIPYSFVQDNLSVSRRGTIRGLHFQHTPAVGKLVSVVKGSAFDVAVDIRSWSKTFGKVYTFVLNDSERNCVWIPPGFAHGFQALDDDTVFAYKVTAAWDPAGEGAVNPFDESLGIRWPIANSIISKKDEIAPSLLYYKGNTLWEKK